MENAIKIDVTFTLSAKSVKGKEKVLKRVDDTLRLNIKELQSVFKDVSIEKVEPAKYKIYLRCEQWTLLVYELIKFAQNIGIGWVCAGDIDTLFDFRTNSTPIVGVESICIVCDNKFTITKNIKT